MEKLTETDYYALLGVDKKASEQEINKAYKKLAVKYRAARRALALARARAHAVFARTHALARTHARTRTHSHARVRTACRDLARTGCERSLLPIITTLDGKCQFFSL